MRTSNYDKEPVVHVRGHGASCWRGWDDICARLREAVAARGASRTVLVVECYPGVDEAEVLTALRNGLQPERWFDARDALKCAATVRSLVAPDVTDDPVFGRLTQLALVDFFDAGKCAHLKRQIGSADARLVLVYGTGATLLCEPDVLVYADLARWQAQLRFRRGESSNLGVAKGVEPSIQYKQAFFVDWRVCDRHKQQLFSRSHFVLDTNTRHDPKLASAEAVREGLRQVVRRPFRVVPYFDPAPWGGQWMKEICDLDRNVRNFGWCFDCVPEENSLRLGVGDTVVELPSINLVLSHSQELLGEAVSARFGRDFPIRFDLLDTIGGGNLSLQVHPLTTYIQEHFGLHYTQDESYYLLDAAPGASVYLGLRRRIDRERMLRDLEDAQTGGAPFDADRYVRKWPARKHDHFLIPAGTIHCSGAGAMVLEISATPYIFTFKLWDWGRMGLDGTPRPIHLARGFANVQWDRDDEWTRANLLNRVTPIGSGDGWREERTGLHERSFIETRRHWFGSAVPHHTSGSVNVLNLVEGDEAIVESPEHAFEPFSVHYAETFIVPACVGAYTILPAGRGARCATIKAYVRT